MQKQENKQNGSEDFTITRVFNAPRDLVFAAFTKPEHLIHWWGPRGFSIDIRKQELRPGGIFHFVLTGPGNLVMWAKFAYTEIEIPHRLVYIHSFSDEQEGLTRHPLGDTWPLEMHNTVTFDERDGKTIVTITSRAIHATETEQATFDAGHPGMTQGYGETLDQLEEYLDTLNT